MLINDAFLKLPFPQSNNFALRFTKVLKNSQIISLQWNESSQKPSTKNINFCIVSANLANNPKNLQLKLRLNWLLQRVFTQSYFFEPSTKKSSLVKQNKGKIKIFHPSLLRENLFQQIFPQILPFFRFFLLSILPISPSGMRNDSKLCSFLPIPPSLSTFYVCK